MVNIVCNTHCHLDFNTLLVPEIKYRVWNNFEIIYVW